MDNHPFEKFRSNLEKRKVFRQVFEEQGSLICKFDGDQMITFRAASSDNECFVSIAPAMLPLQGEQMAIGHFSAGPDRYFFNGMVDLIGNAMTIGFSIDLFKLERRQSLRVNVPEDYGLSVNMTAIAGKTAFRTALVADVSSTGLRIYFPDDRLAPFLTANKPVKGTLHLPSSKAINFEGVVKHSREIDTGGIPTTHFGIEVHHTSENTQQRMLALVMDIQRSLIGT